MSKKQKKMLVRIGAGAVLFALALLLPQKGALRLAAFIVPYAVVGWDVLWRAVRNITRGQVFDGALARRPKYHTRTGIR